MLVLVKIRENGKEYCNLYDNKYDYIQDFTIFYKHFIEVLELRVTGKSYGERKANLRDLAIEYQNMDKSGLSWGEYAEIEEFFIKQAKKYGLYVEFIDNGIVGAE